jgi:hypothetical protein
LSDLFPIEKGLKHGDLSSPVLFSIDLEYAFMDVQGNQIGLLVCADDVNLLGGNINTMQINTEYLIDAGLEVNAKENMYEYMSLSRHESAGHNRDVKVANISLKMWHSSNYLVRTATNQNLIQEEIKRSLNSGYVWYHSVRNLVCLKT